jgi:hypothetical protein
MDETQESTSELIIFLDGICYKMGQGETVTQAYPPFQPVASA